MRLIKGLVKLVLWLLAVVILVAAGLIGYLSLTEFSPADIETVAVKKGARSGQLWAGKHMTMVSWNIGYAGLGRNQNFFMDGGTMVRPEQKKDVEDNLSGIVSALLQQQADLYLLQEVDVNSHRTYNIHEGEAIQGGLMMGSAFVYNYKCAFVPFPWPMMGKVESGLMTLTSLNVTGATRESLPVPFSWPMRLANLKRCLLVERIPVEGTDNELVVINLHLEAYDSGEGKKAQTEQLMKILEAEYRNGNYVIAGGDFNQNFPGVTRYPLLNEDYWTPGLLSEADLPTGFSYAFDASTPTCRLLNENYTGDRERTQFYVIDGFILSSNIKVNSVQTVDLNFQYSDHQPVRLEFTLASDDNG